MIIDCVGCLHGHYPSLEGGDLLIITGDLTAQDKSHEYFEFRDWLRKQDYRKKVFIAGNHDGRIATGAFYFNDDWLGAAFLYDKGTEFEGLKIWGSPFTKTFKGINPHATAFTCSTEKELMTHWELIPEDTNILVTHSPPFCVLDGIPMEDGSLFHVGSPSLLHHVQWDQGLKLHVFSHIHEAYGEEKSNNGIFSTHSVNCSIMNKDYKPKNKPIRVIL
jgi:Icc-related predicted phosphoesterase